MHLCALLLGLLLAAAEAYVRSLAASVTYIPLTKLHRGDQYGRLFAKGINRIKERRIESYEQFTSQQVDTVNHPLIPVLSKDPSLPFVEAVIKAADMRKADSIVALRTSKLTTVMDFEIICSGFSRPQNQAIANNILDTIEEEFGRRPIGRGVPEGKVDSGWILLDYGEIVVNVMTPKAREFYDLEGRWKGAETVQLDSWLVPNGPSANNNDIDLTSVVFDDASNGKSNPNDRTGVVVIEKKDLEDPFWS